MVNRSEGTWYTHPVFPVVLFRSYTGAQIRYYIERSTGDVRVTEFVPGITSEEMPSEESLNVWDYVG